MQVYLLRAAVNEWKVSHPGTKLVVDVSTVDSIQGQERDIIILSAVRSCPEGAGVNLQFLSDERRMNVAFTRARHGLWVVGDSRTLTSCTCFL